MSASDDRFLPGDGGEVVNSGIEDFRVTDGVAASHIDSNFNEFRNLHNVFVVEVVHESWDNFGFIFIEKSRQGNTSLIDRFAAFFTDAGIFTVYDFMSDASGFIASGADELNFARVKGHFFRGDAALGDFDRGFRVAFNLINAFDDDLTGVRESGDNFTLFALIFTGEDLNGIAFFNVEFNDRQGETSFS